jgi:hypothetical protein
MTSILGFLRLRHLHRLKLEIHGKLGRMQPTDIENISIRNIKVALLKLH